LNKQIKTSEPRKSLVDTIRKNSSKYGNAVLKLVIVKENSQNYLYEGEVTIQYKNEEPIDDKIHEYDFAILATISISLHELLDLIASLEDGKISIKNISEIITEGKFEESCYQISSRTRYAGFYNNWPCWCFRFSSANSRVHLSNLHNHLIKPGKPPFPDVFDATHAFLNSEYKPNVNTPIGLDFLIPDYRAKISTLEIAEKKITVFTDKKELNDNQLIVQVYCESGENEVYPSKDLKLDESGKASIEIPFIPDQVQSYLVEKDSEEALDAKSFGKWYTDRNDGVIVKTSKEKVETIIGKGESQTVEFKQDLDKEKFEFLETVVSFANTNDGIILLGVNNESRVVGHYDDFEKTEKKILGLVSGNCEPDISVTVESMLIENKPVVVVNVKEGKNKPYLLIGKSAYRRVNKDDYPFKRLDFEEVYSKKGKQDSDLSSF